ncbi:hypothetical protein [Mangrovivirga cuniculi]|uniref:Lipocalin-like domain-containing protein n=1 Tax=Mangrovivirga cuniculi TaxID=2715131 RepID=A0A4D7JQ66_9BACT|nr:hypothetical protein [Mangrovivirga cuniculi]QCK15620.1 hypothetical protein DCC35_13130 [Mangrovivirga cuniculi]
MKLLNIRIIAVLMSVCVIIFSCSDDEDENLTPNNPDGIALDNVSDGQGKAASSGSLNLNWTGNASWESTTSINSGGITYLRWIVTLEGPTSEDYIRIQIVENEANSSEAGPDDGTYIIGGSMDENDVSVYTSEDSYFFDPSSDGEFVLTKSGNVLEITLDANNLEKGGIGSSDQLIDLDLALKASEN